MSILNRGENFFRFPQAEKKLFGMNRLGSPDLFLQVRVLISGFVSFLDFIAKIVSFFSLAK